MRKTLGHGELAAVIADNNTPSQGGEDRAEGRADVPRPEYPRLGHGRQPSQKDIGGNGTLIRCGGDGELECLCAPVCGDGRDGLMPKTARIVVGQTVCGAALGNQNPLTQQRMRVRPCHDRDQLTTVRTGQREGVRQPGRDDGGG